VNVNLKPVEDQGIVLTGATSGIGLTTARMAAERGARVVLAARSEDDLRKLTQEIRSDGGDAVYVVADVRDRDDVRDVAEVARETYGGFDTWVNVAGAFIYGRLEDTPIEDMRDQFDTNVWGLLYGSLEAADYLKDRGGAIINIGSVASDQAMPLQGSYSASKHAVKGFTDALRMELEDEAAPVSVTLVKPAAIDTPYPEHAKNYMDRDADLAPPIYAPETVAREILDAAENPKRDAFVGGGAAGMSLLGRAASGLMDRVMEATMFDQQRADRPPRPDAANVVDEPVGGLRERGGQESHVSERSLYNQAVERGILGKLGPLALGAVGLFLYSRLQSKRGRRGSTSGDAGSSAFEDIPVESPDDGDRLRISGDRIRRAFRR
jgi:short-subunit dehydrogenase